MIAALIEVCNGEGTLEASLDKPAFFRLAGQIEALIMESGIS
jgi:hypothetical protein